MKLFFLLLSTCVVLFGWTFDSTRAFSPTAWSTPLRPAGQRTTWALASAKEERIPSTPIDISSLTETTKTPQWTLVVSWIIPWCIALAAFFTYDATSTTFDHFIDQYRMWSQVDGGALQMSMITPALNGPIQTSISILFGTLVAMTVSNLYQRQLNMHMRLMNVIEGLRYMHILLEEANLPTHVHKEAQDILHMYSQRLAKDLSQQTLEAIDNLHLNTFVGFIVQYQDDVLPSRLVDQLYANVKGINVERAALVSSGQSTFPIVHYVNLITLATLITVIFLVETNQDALRFIGNFELRLCWALLLGTFSMLGVVLVDLNNPFGGSFGLVDAKHMELLQATRKSSTTPTTTKHEYR